jgi:site-specific DNA-methyltransferase (adenine-specific)
MKLYKGDCLEQHKHIKDGSVDLILTDLPYGTVKGMGGNMEKYKHLSNADWDNVIDTNKIMQIANRILRKNGKMILTAQQPFTTELISKAIPNLPHSYNMYWDKMHFANCLVANKAPVSYIEDVLVFSKMNDIELAHPIRNWLKETQEKANIFWNDKRLHEAYLKSGIAKNIQSAKVICQHKLDWNYSQIQEITPKHYDVLNVFFVFNKTKEDLKLIYDDYKKKFASTFNLWEGKKYKSNILKYKKDYDGYHPTQKPVLLLEDLMKTFSNENDSVVDLTMGSGTTGVACKNLNRKFIGIEIDETYFNIAEERIEKHTTQQKLFTGAIK